MLNPAYLEIFLSSDYAQRKMVQVQVGGTRQALTKTQIGRLGIPLPSIDTQLAAIREVEAEQSVVKANRDLIKRFEEKIQVTIAGVWDGGSTAVPRTGSYAL